MSWNMLKLFKLSNATVQMHNLGVDSIVREAQAQLFSLLYNFNKIAIL